MSVFLGIFSAAYAKPEKNLIIFSNIKSISSSVTQAQCQSLFPHSAYLEKLNRKIKIPAIIGPLLQIISLEKIKKSESNKNKIYADFIQTWKGESKVSLDAGKSFTIMPFTAKGKKIKSTQVTTGNIILNNLCSASFEDRSSK